MESSPKMYPNRNGYAGAVSARSFSSNRLSCRPHTNRAMIPTDITIVTASTISAVRLPISYLVYVFTVLLALLAICSISILEAYGEAVGEER